jgi:hypothetical protein
MTLDPFGGYVELPQSQNRYAYVMNNPLKYIDPLGLQHEPEVGTYIYEECELEFGRYSVSAEIVSRDVLDQLLGNNNDVDYLRMSEILSRFGPGSTVRDILLESLIRREQYSIVELMNAGVGYAEALNIEPDGPQAIGKGHTGIILTAPSYGSTPAQADVLSFGQPQIEMPEPIYERVHKNYLHQIAEEEGLINVGEIITEYCISRLISKGISLLIFETTIVPRTALGADGAFSQTIKTKLFGKTMTVEHQVFRNGEMIHNNFPYVWP